MKYPNWYHIFLAILILDCSKPSGNSPINKEPAISNSKVFLEDFSQYFSPKHPIDTTAEYLSNFDFSSCNSIELFLTQLYNRDQIYRDSTQYYRKTDLGKSRSFGKKFKEMDETNIKILKNSLHLLLQRKDCINKSITIDAIWLVAHHSNDNQLIKAVQPAVEYALEKGIMASDSYKLYYGNLNHIKLSDTL